MNLFQQNDPSLESQWRALILFGKNSATYKFAFAKALLEIVEKEKCSISLEELSIPFARNVVEHLKQSDKQTNSPSSKYLSACNEFIAGKITENTLFETTQRLGFVNVIDAFHNVNGGVISKLFYEKDFKSNKKGIVITNHLLQLKESVQYQSFELEVEGRWKLVETAWNININPRLLAVKYDEEGSALFMENNIMRRVNICSAKDSLNGYQKGKCFFSFQDISIKTNSNAVCHVDHFFPHRNKISHAQEDSDINGVWNLVLIHPQINSQKSARIPKLKYLERLYNRNEFFISSKHPLGETIKMQTGFSKETRRKFLQRQYNIALSSSITSWEPDQELPGTF